MKNNKTLTLTYSALCLALALVLPLLTGQIPQIGRLVSPMHLPVLLCGFLCGWQYGLAVGFISPLLRYLIFGMPVLLPTGIAMAFELAAYGLAAGLLYRNFPSRKIYIYVSLIIAMLSGRLVWGMAMRIILGFTGDTFTAEAFLAGAVTGCIPGMIIQIILIPVIVIALEQSHLVPNGKKQGN